LSILSIDFETRSVLELPDVGVYVYAEHPTTDIWCMAWASDDEEPAIWTPADVDGPGYLYPLPQRILDHIDAGGEIRAWNAQFERIIWREIMVKRYGAPAVALEQWVCSAAEAAAMALPRRLGQAAKALGIPEQKDDEGRRLMLRMAKPRRVEEDGTIVWWDVPDRVARLHEYCRQDVRTERSVVGSLRRLTKRERELYLLDQRINDRGVRVDKTLVEAGQRIVDIGLERANADLAAITGGDVTAITNHRRLTDWVRAQGVEVDGVSKKAVAAILEGDLPAKVRQALELRAEAGRSSIAKLTKLLAWACADWRARGMLLFHAASTGRWSGMGPQPQNFPRGEVDDVEWFIDWVLAGDYDAIDALEHPIVVVLSLLRACFVAASGHDLIAADFSAIEARVLNWVAGQEDVLESFRQYDAAPKAEKPKHDPYRKQAVAMGRGTRPELVTKEDRQAGKAAELGCGFQMGWRKFIGAAWDVYQVRVTKEEAKAAVASYRASHEKVEQFWYDINDAAMRAVQNPGTVEAVGPARNVRLTCQGKYLYVLLPSGRPLCYAAPKVTMEPARTIVHEDGEIETRGGRLGVTYLGVDPFTKQWGRIRTYGGHLTENVVQAIARDLIAEGMLRLEARGYPPILSVHDEAVAEVLKGFGSVQEFEAILSELPDWATGCPVAAEGWRGERYRK
jgi:DNA polymerase